MSIKESVCSGMVMAGLVAACADVEPALDEHVTAATAKVSLCHATFQAGAPYKFIAAANPGQHESHAADFLSTDPSCAWSPTVPSFRQGPTHSTSQYPQAIASADVDQDGITDVLVSNQFAGTISVLRGHGDGTFTTIGAYATGWVYPTIELGRFDADAYVDALVLSSSGDLTVLRGFGNGSFAIGTGGVTLPANLGGLTTGDLDGNGVLDVVASGVDTVVIAYGNGNGTFRTPVTLAVPGTHQAVAIADVNADGKRDLITASYFAGTLTLLRATNRGFAAPVSFAAGEYPSAIAVGDLNLDGKLDIVNAGLNGIAAVHIGRGDATFEPAILRATGGGSASIALRDISGDGSPDIITSNGWANTVSIILGTRTTPLGEAIQLPTGQFPRGLAIAELDGDGKLDLAFANYYAHDVGVLLTSAPPPPPPAVFGEATSYATGMGPRAIASGDLDADGILDLVTADWDANTISVLHGTGGGAYAAPTSYAVGTRPNGIVAVDLDNDLDLDLAVANLGTALEDLESTSTVSFLRNNGDGTFAAAVEHGAGHGPIALDAGDLDADGDLDLAIVNMRYSITLLLGTGSGDFAPAVTYAAFTGGRAIRVGDVTGDGTLDVVSADENNARLLVYPGNGDGTLAGYYMLSTGDAPYDIEIADVDDDGIADLISAAFLGGGASVLRGTGGGAFAGVTTYPTGANPSSVEVGDIDGDGALDLVVTNFTDNNVVTLHGSGTGSFGSPVSYATGSIPFASELRDLSGDGKLDIAVANLGSSSVSVLLAN